MSSAFIVRLFSVLLSAASTFCYSQVIDGIVTDPAGLPVPGARVEARSESPAARRQAITGVAGDFHISLPAAGRWTLSASRQGFAPVRADVDAAPGPATQVTLQLAPAVLAQELAVSANLVAGVPEVVNRTPGSIDVLDPAMLQNSRLFGFDEALRKAAGVFARAEEGFSLRPNIGIRGLNPTRSSKVLLLEDGVPLAYAPYGDNASYYHPPVERFESIEVVKGSGQIAWGPNTVGGVVNYVTPAIPDRFSGSMALSGGNRDYFNGHVQLGGTFRGTGILLDALRKQGEGARDNVRSGLNDVNFKILTTLASNQALSLKANYYSEDSQLTYSGLRLSEWAASPRSNPFANDRFYGRRLGASAQHTASLQPNLILITTLYGAGFSRDWWRQSSNSGQRPNDAADPACAGMANLNTTCGNEGRLRDYWSWGADPRLRWNGALGRLRADVDTGLRVHFENQNRVQMNGSFPTSRTGAVVEDNQRRNQAYSGYFQPRLSFGEFTVTPGVRLEHVRFQRTNRLFNGGKGITGDTSLTQPIPGLGVAYAPSSRLTVFAGAHRGFSPPRTEDIISNSGGFLELDPELSWNYEAGLRLKAHRHAAVESTYFRMNYSNQIVPASLAGGVGSLLTSAGRTLHQGAELSGRWELRSLLGSGNHLFLRSAWTWIPSARYAGTRFSSVAGFPQTLVTGNRLPYSPESLLTASATLTHRKGVNVLLEMVQTGGQYTDDLNTVNPTADGQRGRISGNVLWNATMNVPLESLRTTAFLTVKNAFDRLVLVDRSRGMLPGSPRLIQAGFRWTF